MSRQRCKNASKKVHIPYYEATSTVGTWRETIQQLNEKALETHKRILRMQNDLKRTLGERNMLVESLKEYN